MRFMTAATAALLAVGLALGAGAPARAQDEAAPLIIGTNRLLMLRHGDTLNGRPMTVQERINHVQDLFPKYLGGPMGRITSKPWGDRVHLYLNGDFVLAVTPADAKGTGYKSAAQLAPVWAKALQRGFEEARVQGTPARRAQ
jgi:hypothetical protein